LSGVMRYTTGGQDAHPTRVLLLKFVPHNKGICCKRGIQVIEEIVLQNRIEFNMEDEIVNDEE
ncbi:MAG: hypothetical protein ACKPJ4_03910, partial [Dolichospermum sp.]